MRYLLLYSTSPECAPSRASPLLHPAWMAWAAICFPQPELVAPELFLVGLTLRLQAVGFLALFRLRLLPFPPTQRKFVQILLSLAPLLRRRRAISLLLRSLQVSETSSGRETSFRLR